MTTTRIAEFEDLIGQYSRTICRAACYKIRITGPGESAYCSKTGQYLEPNCLVKIMSFSSVRDKGGWTILAWVKTLFDNQPEVLIWVGDIKR